MSRRPLVALTLMVALVLPAAAAADTPPLLNWGELVPGFTPGLDLSDANECTRGSHRCVESVIRRMNKDLRKMGRTCEHHAIFQLGYTRTTEAYYESSQIDGFYADVPWMHHYDAVFAAYYLQPQEDWRRGRTAQVAPAWREAFASADAEELTGTGNFLMGMNAHINRDLPFVLADIGLTDDHGSSRKPDHERVNEFLNHVGDDLTPEVVARFDPSFDTSSADDVLVGFGIQQAIQEWRERAWNNAWLMTYTDPATASLVAQGIEAGTALLAQQLRAAYAYDDEADRAARNAHCEEHGRDYDGFDGTYFDDPYFELADVALPAVQGMRISPLPGASLAQLALAGVLVDVDPATGVEITLQSD